MEQEGEVVAECVSVVHVRARALLVTARAKETSKR
jgi:hypothetical protein